MTQLPKVYDLVMRRVMETHIQNGGQPDSRQVIDTLNKQPPMVIIMLISDAIEERLKHIVPTPTDLKH